MPNYPSLFSLLPPNAVLKNLLELGNIFPAFSCCSLPTLFLFWTLTNIVVDIYVEYDDNTCSTRTNSTVRTPEAADISDDGGGIEWTDVLKLRQGV